MLAKSVATFGKVDILGANFSECLGQVPAVVSIFALPQLPLSTGWPRWAVSWESGIRG
jgi:hypothetical protein